MRAPGIPRLYPNGLDYATKAVNIVPPTRNHQIPDQILDLDSSDSNSDAEPQFLGDEHSSGDATIIVPSSGDDTVSGNTRAFQLARQRTTSTAPLIENNTNDPPKHLRRCFEIHSRNESSMSESSDEEVDSGSSSQYMKECKPRMSKFRVNKNKKIGQLFATTFAPLTTNLLLTISLVQRELFNLYLHWRTF